jgi:FkbM family methyltransferase
MPLHKSDLEDDIARYIRERLSKWEGGVLFDVGANVGWFTWQFLRQFPNTDVYAFEPVMSIYKKLQENIADFSKTMDCTTVRCKKLALGCNNEHAYMTSTPAVTTNRIVNATEIAPDGYEEVEVVRGDAFCNRNGISEIGYLKVDAEGYDMNVIKGFSSMIEGACIDFIQVEASFEKKSDLHVSVIDFEKYLGDRGYRLFRIINQASGQLPYLTRADVVFISANAIAKYT